jgi:hypothetical protein
MCPIEYYEIMRKSKDKNLSHKIATIPTVLIDTLFTRKFDSMNVDFFNKRGYSACSIPLFYCNTHLSQQKVVI